MLFIYLTFVFMIITGACNTIFLRLQNTTDIDKILGVPYNHPWFQTFNMFVGEFYCLFGFLYVSYTKKRQIKEAIENLDESKDIQGNVKPKASIFIFMITCGCDLLGTTLLNFALINMAGSVFQMLRGGVVIVTSTFSVLFLKRKLYRHHLLGIVIVFIGVFLVGLGSQLESHEGQKQETKLIGIVLLLISLIFSGCQFVIQEKIMTKYSVDPLQLVALEGIWGVCAFIILLPIFQYIKCSNFEGVDKICSMDDKHQYYIENTLFTFKQIGSYPILLIWIIGSTFSIGFFNFFGINVTKYVSAATRAVMDNSRTILVWIFFLITGDEHFLWLQLIGFLILIVGTLIYNELLEIPVAGLNSYTKKAIKQREKESQALLSKEGNINLKSDSES